MKIDQLRQSHQRRICFWLDLASNTGHGGLSKTTQLVLLDSLLQEVCTSSAEHGRSPWVRSGWASAVVRLKLLSSGLKRARSIDKWILILYSGLARFPAPAPAGLSGSTAPSRVTHADSLIDDFDGYINVRGFYIMVLDIFWLAGKELHALMIIYFPVFDWGENKENQTVLTKGECVSGLYETHTQTPIPRLKRPSLNRLIHF